MALAASGCNEFSTSNVELVLMVLNMENLNVEGMQEDHETMKARLSVLKNLTDTETSIGYTPSKLDLSTYIIEAKDIGTTVIGLIVKTYNTCLDVAFKDIDVGFSLVCDLIPPKVQLSRSFLADDVRMQRERGNSS